MNPLNEGNPSELLDLAAEIQRGFDETGKLSVRLIRYAFARERALINLSELENLVTKKLRNLETKKLRNLETIISPVTGEQVI